MDPRSEEAINHQFYFYMQDVCFVKLCIQYIHIKL